MGISQSHKESTGFSRCVDRHTISVQNKINKPAKCRSVALAVTPSTISTPTNKNKYPSPSLDGIGFRSIPLEYIIDISDTPTNAVTE